MSDPGYVMHPLGHPGFHSRHIAMTSILSVQKPILPACVWRGPDRPVCLHQLQGTCKRCRQRASRKEAIEKARETATVPVGKVHRGWEGIVASEVTRRKAVRGVIASAFTRRGVKDCDEAAYSREESIVMKHIRLRHSHHMVALYTTEERECLERLLVPWGREP